jgi:hypothetical protein
MVQDGDDALLDELKTLRKGRGVNAARIALGPRLRELAGVAEQDSTGVTRRKVIGTLDRLAEPLPADLALAARAALGLLPAAQQPFLAERVQWLADQLRRDVRTARRRVDLGLAAMAEHASAAPAPVAPVRPAGDEDERWYVREFRALLRLDRPTPEAMDTRVVVATVDGLTQIDALITVPRDGPARTGPHDLLVEALYGATIVGRERVTASRFRYALRLPRPLRAGEAHEYGLLFRVPPDQPMRNHYVHYAPRRCDRFELRVRFDPERVPTEVWRVDGVFPRDLDDGLPDTDAVAVDDAAEVHLVFDRLRPGFGYGARWTPPPPYELRHEA